MPKQMDGIMLKAQMSGTMKILMISLNVRFAEGGSLKMTEWKQKNMGLSVLNVAKKQKKTSK